MTLPNLIGIGAQRAATTWMHHCLSEHPSIFAPEKKEIHFFDENFEKGVEWYESHFRSATQPVVAEVTPNYLNAEPALQRMADTVPDAKLFVVLREPISRAYSSYKLLYNEHYRGKSFDEACEASGYLIRLSKYAEDLKRAFLLFGEDNVQVFLYDDVSADPGAVVKRLYSFAGVDADFIPDSIDVRYNPVILPGAQDFFARIRLGSALERFKQTAIGIRLKNALTARKQRHETAKPTNSTKKKIASDEYIEKLKSEFRADILEVQELIGRDLSGWL